MPNHKPSVVSLLTELWQAQCEQIILSAKLVQSVEEDIEFVHQYRIAIRKARSLLVFLKPLLRGFF